MVKNKRMTYLFLAALLLSAFPAAAQGGWRVESAARLALPQTVPPESGAVIFAPDGRQLAYPAQDANGAPQTCVLDVPAGTTHCLPMPEGAALLSTDPNSAAQVYAQAAFSAEGARLAVTGAPLNWLHRDTVDTDLTILDLQSAAATVYGQDQYDGPAFTRSHPAVPPIAPALEFHPTWSPDGGHVAVERTLLLPGPPESSIEALTVIAAFDITSGASRPIAPLPVTRNAGTDAGLTTGLAWSPDGLTIAAAFYNDDPAGQNADEEGVWLIDALSGEMAQWASLRDLALAAGGPAEGYIDAHPATLRWSPDGERLLLWLNETPQSSASGAPMLLSLDAPPQVIALPPHPAEIARRQLVQPLNAAWSPGGEAVLVTALIYEPYPNVPTIRLDPAISTGTLPVGVFVYDVAAAEAALLGHLPQVLGPPYAAAWGAAGDALVNGYALRLGQG